MAQLLTVRLSRNDSSTSWGFRLQGGKDFNTPLLIQKVNVGSLAEKAGLQVGDAVIRVNGKEVADVRHKDAQDIIVRAGNLVEFTIQRGGTVTWKPAVTPVGSVPSPNPYISTSPSPVTKTSLASSPHQSPRIPQGFNSPSKPFSPQQTNGGYVNENGSIKAIVNKQYNTPVGIYSDESIAETLSAQAEVLAGGVLGVNFKKNEKNYNAENSEVFKMVLETEKEPKSPEPERPSSASYFASLSHAVGGQATSSRPQTPTAASLDRPRSITSSPICPVSAPPPSAPDNLTCSECRQNIVGVFVRIKEKNLHVECFKCATCGTSLKNVGYYTINNKLYCDIHAKMVARQNPPAPNLEPVTVSPSQHGASKIISTALIANSKSAPLSPQPTLAPVPFHPPRQSPTHVSSPVPHSQPFSAVNGSKPYSPSNTFSSPISAPKPGYFQSQKALPFSKDTHKPTPSPLCSSETQPVSYYNPSQRRLPFLKPRAEKASAFMPVMKSTQSKPAAPAATTEPTAGHALSTVFESYDQDDAQMAACHHEKLSICSQEVKNVFSRHLAGSPALSDRPESPVPSESANEFQHYETPRNKPLEVIQSRPHSVRSLSPCERPATPSQIVVFPPEMPACYHPRVASPLPIYPKPRHVEQLQCSGDDRFNDEIGTCVVEQSCQRIEPRDENDDVCKCIIEKTRETLTITCVSPIPTSHQASKPEPIKIVEVTTWQSQPRPATPPRCSIPRKEVSEVACSQSRSRPTTPSRCIPPRKVSEVATLQSQPRPETPSRCSSLPKEVSGVATSQSRPRPTTPSRCIPHKNASEVATLQSRPRPETPPRCSIPLKEVSEVATSQSRPRPTTPSRCIPHKNASEVATLHGRPRPATPSRYRIPPKEVSEVACSQSRPRPTTPLRCILHKNAPEVATLQSRPRPETPPRYMISEVSTSQSQPRPASLPRCTLPKEESEVATLQNLPRPATPPGFIASLLTTASDRPFTPIEPAKATIFTEPVPLPPETIPYLPTSKEESHRLPDSQRPMSPMTFNLTIASERSYSPLPTVVNFEDLFPPGAEPPLEEEPKRPSLASALTVAPRRSYTPLSRGITEQPEKEETDVKVPDLSEDPSVILTRPTLDIKKIEKDTKKAGAAKPVCVRSSLIASPFYVTEAAFPPICDELKAKFEKRLRTGSISDKNVHKSVHAETAKEVEEKRPARSPFTPTGLYKPINLPHYQQCVKELASRNKTPLSRRNTPTPKMTESCKNTPTPRAELSRKNTPTPRGDSCRKPTPIGFEATVSTQQKIFQDPAAPACGTLKTSALSFLTQSKDISEKVPPVLGYQPGSIVENMSSYTKVEQCVRTVCEKTLKHIQSTGQSVQSCSNQSNESRMTKSNTPRCSSPANTPAVLAKEEKQPAKKPSSRSSTPVKNPSRPSTPVKKTSRPSTPVSQSNITVSSAQQVFHPSSTSTSQVSETKATSTAASSPRQHFFTSSSQTKSMAASHITHNLSKTLTAIASKHQSYNISSKNLSTSITSSDPNQTGSNVGAGYRTGTSAGLSAPRRGKGVWNPQNSTPGVRIPLCAQCSSQIRGPFITALGKIWCPEHFICVNKTCRRSLLDIGFVEEPSGLHCEYCFEKYLAPTCGKCSRKIKGDCLNAIGKHFHPECFVCAYCNKLFGNSPFFLEEGLPYCENDWNELFTTKCFACGFPIEAGDRWVEALNNNYHSPCFNCTTCKTNLEGQSFYAKGGRPFCKSHAR